MKNRLKIGTKPPKRFWVLFEIEKCARNCQKTSLNILVLLYRIKKCAKIDEKPPKVSWVFFDIEKCAKNVKKETVLVLLQNLKNVLKIAEKSP